VPVYVPRDIDWQLRELLASGGFVLIVGDSTAGKSRSAYEAIAATLPEHVLIVPHGRHALPSALARAAEIKHCVIWLDDLEQFIGALTRNRITELVEEEGCHRVILATLRAAEETRYTSDSIADQSGRQAHRDAREVLEQAERIQLPRLFTSAERRRARLRLWDRRIADALAHVESYGIAEYLAAGPELLRDWEDAWNPITDADTPAHPRGAALVMAAVDIRRAGYTAPLPVELIDHVHRHYLEARGGRRLQPESSSSAWNWACQPRRATTALLQPIDDQHVEVFDYLVDTVQRHSQPGDHVPDPVIRAAIDAGDPADADSIAATAYTHGRYELAEHAYRAAYQAKLHNPTMGREHQGTLASQDKLALVMTALGRPEEAEIGHRAVLATATTVLGPTHVITTASRANLARALRALGRLEEAEAEYRIVLSIYVQVLGPEHRDTVATQGSLARVLHDLGQLEASAAEHRAALNICSRIFGTEHPSTLTSRGSLASVLHDLGRLDEAEAEHRAVLAIRTRVLGPEHPRTLTSRSLLARVLHDLGRLDEAEAEERAALDIRMTVLGPEHPRTLTSRGSLGRVLRDLGRLEEAEAEQLTVLSARTRLLGAEHPSTLTSRGSLASVLHDLGRLDEAEAEHRAVLAIRTRVLGPEHPRTLTSRSLLARVLRDLRRLDEAEAECRAVLEARIRMLGPAHPDTEVSRRNLALVLRDKEQSEIQSND
jgi:tetratricopeptide (TPR) repeat protein